ncbi:corrinoid protein [Paradesulfitobacterium ferrireducens]|uniref:corrinoid protein n=1 Tax=Paradesulfitobacterium ferrireducens TaxID=2816476 RepID=UPI001A8EB21D|nr:corrinoid protein [Paradesulfitobacterium ferrireducens]
MSLFQEMSEAVISGSAKKVKELSEQALAQGNDPQNIINDGLIPGMNIVGARFKANEIYVPEVLISARAMHAGLNVVKPLLSAADTTNKGTVVVGTVKGDLHDIGKNLVCMMLEGAGYKVIDIGIDVAPEQFVKAVEENKPQIVGLSALLTTTMINMRNTIDLLKSYPVKVMVGGAPVTEKYAQEIGAHAYAADAASAVDRANELVAS